MDADIIVETLPQLGVCNLCLNEGAVKSMLVGHKHNGISEDYNEMLQKCFSIDVTQVELGDVKRVICESCIIKLRDSAHFKHQVQESLSMLQATHKLQKEAQVKQETPDYSESYDNLFEDQQHVDDDDDEKDEDFKPPIKKETGGDVKKVKIAKKPKKSFRYPSNSSKTQHSNNKDTEEMLQLGLFPFKMKKNSYCCSICPASANNLDEIKSHTALHTKSNIHLAFNKMMFSDSHRFYKVDKKLRCKICTADVASFDELKQHTQNCAYTRKKNTNTNKWNNLPFKLEKDQVDCPVCQKRFLNFVSLNTHMNIHYPNYICESCGKAFASKARLRGHMRTHEEGQFPCRYCDAVFDRITKRENHVSKEHKAGIRYACKRCNISLPSFYARQKHLAEVHNEELKRYKCKACTQSYITPGHLSSHVRRDHLNERNHKCDKCDQAFYTKNALKMHMIKHDGARIHVCNVCQKSYQRKKTLREHMRIHENDKRFVCPVCGRAFTQKCTLKGHLKVHESKINMDRVIDC